MNRLSGHNVFDYDPVVHAWAYIQQLYLKGRCLNYPPDVLKIRHKGEGTWSALAVVNLNRDKIIAGYAQCHSINFTALSAWELCEELAVLTTAKKLKKHFSGDFTPYSAEEIEKWKERLYKRAGA